MYKDPTEFRARFKAYKEGKMPYENGLPKFAGGTPGLTSTQQAALDDMYNYFNPLGYDIISISGMGGNGLQESGLNPDIVSKSGYAGVWQNNKNLQNAIKDMYGDHSKDNQFRYANAWVSGDQQIRKGKHAAHTALGSGKFKKAGYKTAEEAADAWLKNYERAVILDSNGKVIGYQDQGKRKAFAKAAYNYLFGKYGKGGSAVAPEPIVEQAVSTAVRNTIPAEQTHARWEGAENVSPFITGKPMVKLRPRIQLPNLIDVIEDDQWEPEFKLPGMKNGKLPRYGGGKDGYRYIKNDETGGWDRITNDDEANLMSDLVVTPRGIRNKFDYESNPNYVAPRQKNEVVKQDNDLWTRQQVEKANNTRTWRSDAADVMHSIGEGALLASTFTAPEIEPLVYPAYQTAKSAIANVIKTYTEKTAPTMLSMMVRPQMRLNVPLDSWMHFPQTQQYIRYPYSVSWDDFIKDPKVGKYFDEGGEAIIYESKNNPGYLTKLKSELGEGRTLEDLEFMVNRDLHVNDLPGVEPIQYKGFSVSNNPIKILDPVTKKPKTILNERFYPIYEQKKLTPYHKVNTEAFDIDQEMLVNDWANQHGYKHLPNGWLKYGNISISDQGFNNFAFDDFGNMKFIDPMIQNFANGKSPIHIKPANRGKFTALKKRTGHSASWFKQNGTPAQKKMATFALNAKKWKH